MSETAGALYAAARKAELDAATWEHRADLYRQRGKALAAAEAAERAQSYRRSANDLQQRADVLDLQ
jgi:hypothetical protein